MKYSIGKIYNFWHAIKSYLALKEAGEWFSLVKRIINLIEAKSELTEMLKWAKKGFTAC